MKICELLLRNFGKFSGRSIELSDGIQILYGENESGKSTIHTFIKGMLFGMERGRGRAANKDAFSRYEPWENPNYYSGSLVFETGGRHFAVERNFDRYKRSVGIVCQEDGEVFREEDGDLEVLLDGLGAAAYENTVSVAQLKAEPGLSLASELKNYATNCYITGDSGLDLTAALEKLEEGRKETDRAIRDLMRAKQEKRDRTEQELSYIWRDIHRIEEDQEYLQEEIAVKRERMEQEEPKEPEVKQRLFDELRPEKWRVHPVEIICFIIMLVLSFLLIPRQWNGFVTIVLFISGLIYIWNRMKIGKKQVKTEPELILEEITPEEEKIPLEKLLWEYERNAEELGEKRIQYENLRETLEELVEITGEYREYEEKKCALKLASERLEELAGTFQKKLKSDLNKRVSEIIREITGGNYTQLVLEEGLSLSLMCQGRKIPVEQVSRGTAEQVHFALRMAAVELMYEEEYPVILDDTFVCYDDKRLACTLKWLSENKRQVLLFTCQKREEETLAKLGIPFRKICI